MIKKAFKTTLGKIGVALAAYGILSVIVSRFSKNPMSIGQAIFIALLFVVAGVILIFVGNKKADKQTSQMTNEKFVSVKDRYPAGTVFTYPNSSVYHTDYYCSSGRADNEPEALSEDEAMQKGLIKCKRCQEYTCYKK